MSNVIPKRTRVAIIVHCLFITLLTFSAVYPQAVDCCVKEVRGAMVEYCDPPPGTNLKPEALTSDTEIKVFREKYGLCLPNAVNIDIDAPGICNSSWLPSSTPLTIPMNTTVNSYFIHADDLTPTTPAISLGGGIVFSERILGIIFTDAYLTNTDDAAAGILRHVDVAYPADVDRGLNPISQGDILNFADEHTVLLTLPLDDVLDQVRVVVAAMDHFHVFKLEQPRAGGFVVRLKGQFDGGLRPATLGTWTYFANPVSKNGCGINYSEAHYKWYPIDQDLLDPDERDAKWDVEIENQFGKASLRICSPKYLMVPAFKNPTPADEVPDYIDHCKCYEVVSELNENEREPVNLDDQWGSWRDVPVEEAKYFCVPVVKRYQGNITPIKNPCDHFTVYSIEETAMLEDHPFRARDQFRRHNGNADSTKFLCVPTLKKSYTAVPTIP